MWVVRLQFRWPKSNPREMMMAVADWSCRPSMVSFGSPLPIQQAENIPLPLPGQAGEGGRPRLGG